MDHEGRFIDSLVSPGRSGTITPNHAMGGQSGGTVDVRVYMDRDGNWQSEVERISGDVSAKTFRAGIEQYQRKALPDAVQRIQRDPRRRG